MQLRSIALATLAALSLHALQAQYASKVVGYSTGDGFADGYTDPASALGSPSRVTPGTFGGPVDPFSGPYLKTQLVSVGTGGSLTVRFDAPVKNSPANPFGADFQVFGNSFFVVTNGFDQDFNYIGAPATDGQVFGLGTSTTRISVSDDGLTYFTLSPTLSPGLKSLFPTDGSGDFGKPVDPSVRASDFSGLTIDGVRKLYGGSGGGTAYDIAWARDGKGNAVAMDRINFVRVEVLTGKVEIDGFSAVAVPEPSTWVLVGIGLGALVVVRRQRCR